VWLSRLYQQFRHLVHEMGKFGAVGSVAYLVDSAILLALDAQGWEPLISKTVSTVVAATVAFAGNRFWTWRHRARSGLAREYGLFSVFNAIGLGISLACLGVTYHWLGTAWPGIFQTSLAVFVSANVVGLGLGTVFRFWSYRRYVFPAAVADTYGDLAAATPGRGGDR
jgi:putative flippase GtrA